MRSAGQEMRCLGVHNELRSSKPLSASFKRTHSQRNLLHLACEVCLRGIFPVIFRSFGFHWRMPLQFAHHEPYWTLPPSVDVFHEEASSNERGEITPRDPKSLQNMQALLGEPIDRVCVLGGRPKILRPAVLPPLRYTEPSAPRVVAPCCWDEYALWDSIYYRDQV